MDASRDSSILSDMELDHSTTISPSADHNASQTLELRNSQPSDPEAVYQMWQAKQARLEGAIHFTNTNVTDSIQTPPISVGPQAGLTSPVKKCSFTGRDSAGKEVDLLNKTQPVSTPPKFPKFENPQMAVDIMRDIEPPAGARKTHAKKPKMSQGSIIPTGANFTHAATSTMALTPYNDSTSNASGSVVANTGLAAPLSKSILDDPRKHPAMILDCHTFAEIHVFLVHMASEMSDKLHSMYTEGDCFANPGVPCTENMPLHTYRKCVSDYFGRNKNTTKSVELWIRYCRKHYQRHSYKVGWQQEKASLIGKQLQMIHQDLQNCGVKVPRFSIKLKSSEEERLTKWAQANDGTQQAAIYPDEDVVDVASTAESDDNDEAETKTKRKKEVKTPAPMHMLHFIHHYFVGEHKSYAQVWQLLFIMNLWVMNAETKETKGPRNVQHDDKEAWVNWAFKFLPQIEIEPELRDVPATPENLKKGLGNLTFNVRTPRVTRKGAITKPSPSSCSHRSTGL